MAAKTTSRITSRIVLFLLAVWLLLLIIQLLSQLSTLTGLATGVLQFCVNNVPRIESPGTHHVTLGERFTLQINATDANNNALSFFDNTSLFEINGSGYISFSHSAADAGTLRVNITVKDDSGCVRNNASSLLILLLGGTPLVTFLNPAAFTNDATPELILVTSSAASCEYSLSSDSSNYKFMDVTGGMNHSQALPELSVGEHTIPVRCNTTKAIYANTSLSFLVVQQAEERHNLTHLNTTANLSTSIPLLPTLTLIANLSQDMKYAPLAAAEFSENPLPQAFTLSGYTTTPLTFYTISPSQEITQSINHVVLVIPYTEYELVQKGIKEEQLAAFSFNTGEGIWKQETNFSLDTAANILRINLTHLSVFALGSATVSAPGEEGGEEGAGGGATGGAGGGGGKRTVSPISEAEEPKVAPPPKFPILHKESALFDVNVNIPFEYQRLLPGSDLPVNIKLVNVYAAAPILLDIIITIEDQKGNTYYVETLKKTVEQDLQFIHRVELSATMPAGTYVVYVRVLYGGEEAISGATFEVSALPSLAGAAARPLVPGMWGLTGEFWSAALIILLSSVFIILILGIIFLYRFLHREMSYHEHEPGRLKKKEPLKGLEKPRKEKPAGAASSPPSAPSLSAASVKSLPRSLPDEELERREVTLIDKLKRKFEEWKEDWLNK